MGTPTVVVRAWFAVGLVLAAPCGCRADQPLTAADHAAIRTLVDRSVERGEIVATADESVCIERGLGAVIGGTEAWNGLRVDGDPMPLARMLYEAAGSCLSETSAGATVAALLIDAPPELARCIGSAVVAEIGGEAAVATLGERRLGGPFDRLVERATDRCAASGPTVTSASGDVEPDVAG